MRTGLMSLAGCDKAIICIRINFLTDSNMRISDVTAMGRGCIYRHNCGPLNYMMWHHDKHTVSHRIDSCTDSHNIQWMQRHTSYLMGRGCMGTPACTQPTCKQHQVRYFWYNKNTFFAFVLHHTHPLVKSLWGTRSTFAQRH